MKKITTPILTMLLIVLSTANVSAQTTVTFNCTGAAQSFTVPPCVTSINVTVAGADGGGGLGGNGAVLTGTIAVTPGQVIGINVGCSGTTIGGAASAGYGGGGQGFASSNGNASYNSAGGGGASTISIGGSTYMIAGGGGGEGGGSGIVGGGAGGCATGVTGASTFGGGATGGTQTAGGIGGIGWISTPPGGSNGGLGFGGMGGFWQTASGGGGGGGYYGGGGGGNDGCCTGANGGGGGGGGSSLVPAGIGCTQGSNNGAGYVIISHGPSTPSLTASDVSICNGASATISALGSPAGGTYSWSNGASGASTTVNPATTTSYTVTYDMAGCTNTTLVTVTVNPQPDVAAETNLNYCPGVAIPVNTFASSTPGTTYAWTNSNTAIGLAASGTSDLPAFTATNTTGATATSTITVTPALGGCTGTPINFTITVPVSPVIDAGLDATICPGTSTTLNASGATTYTWSPAGTLSDPNIANPVASPSATTSYTVTGTDVNGCSSTDIVEVNMNGISILTSANTAICTGDSTTLNSSGASSYSWSPATGLSSATAANPSASPATTTTYTVTGTTAGCTNTGTVTVSVNFLPTIAAGSAATICNGSSTTLAGSGANTYFWSTATGLSNVNIANPIANPTSTTTYTLTGTDVNGCENTDTVSVIVLTLPPADAGTNSDICPGNSTALSGTGGSSYIWSPTTGLSSSTVSNPVANPVSTSNYTVTVTGSNGCTATDVVTVTVNPVPTATAGAATTICQGTSTTLNATGGTSTSYSWSPSTGLSSATVSNPTASPTTTTLYTVTVSNAAGCTATASTLITVNSALSIAAGTATPESCGNTDGTLTAGSITGGSTPYFYSLNGGALQNSATFSNLVTGTYTVTVIDAAGCSTTQTVAVGFTNGVIAGISADPASGTGPLAVTFTNTSTGAGGYFIDYGDGSPVSTSITHTYGNDGSYTVMLVAYNGSAACADTAYLTINVFDEVVIIVPNVFTPNGDGSNDMFMLQSIGLKTVTGTIFNRWGREIGQWGDSPNSGWDGKTDGKAAVDGTYFYIIKATGLDGKEYEKTGFLQLIN